MRKYKTLRVDSVEDELTGAITQQVHTVAARSIHDCNRIAIHLLHPDSRELEDAVETALKDGFELIVVHNNRTWPKGRN